MGHKSGNIGAKGHIVKVVHVIPGVIPGDFFGDFAQYGFGNVLYPCKAIDDGLLLTRLLGTKAGAEAAVADQYSRRAVADNLGQCGLYVHLEVEVRVDIEHAWHQPLVRAIHHLRGGVSGEAVTSRSDLAISHGHVLNAG